MAEYIERVPFEELIEHLKKKEPCKNCYHRVACDAWVRNATTLYDDYIYSVENCPYHKTTADVVEVKHGYWKEPMDELKIFKGRYLICSQCNVMLPITELAAYYYCPNCGAKMYEKALKEREKE